MILLEGMAVLFALAISYQLGQLSQRSDEINAQLEEQEGILVELRLKELAQDQSLENVVTVINQHQNALITVQHAIAHHDEGHAQPATKLAA